MKARCYEVQCSASGKLTDERDVLQHHQGNSASLQDREDLAYEPRARTFDPALLPNRREILTRKTSSQNVDRPHVVHVVADIMRQDRVGEVCAKYGLRGRCVLNDKRRTNSLLAEANLEPTDASKQARHGQLRHRKISK